MRGVRLHMRSMQFRNGRCHSDSLICLLILIICLISHFLIGFKESFQEMAADFLNFSTMQYISFNTDYVLKPDNGKALIMSAFVGRNSQDTKCPYVNN